MPDIQPHVFIAWEVEVTEKYRTIANVVDLPESVQQALADGLTINDIAHGTMLPDKDYLDAKTDLEDWLVEYEEGPYDDTTTSRELDADAMDAWWKR